MRVVIDARSVHPKLDGIGRHVLNLLMGLSSQDSDLEFLVIYSNPLARKLIERTGGNFRVRFQWMKSHTRHQGHWSGWLENAEIPWLLKTHGGDLFHDIGTTGVWSAGTPTVVTVHELASHDKNHIRRMLRNAKLIIAVSQSLALEIESTFSISRPKIRVISNAIDPRFLSRVSETEIRAMRERFKLPGNYFLCVTSNKPNKNIRLVEKISASWTDQPWVFTTLGRSGSDPKNEKNTTRYLGELEDAWLRPLYAASTAVIVPSLYEGFSLPPIEALASGTVPVVSDIAPHREVLGDILPEALFFSPSGPDDTSSLERSLRAVIDGGDSLRSTVFEKFRQVRERYSYIETARQIQAVYREA